MKSVWPAGTKRTVEVWEGSTSNWRPIIVGDDGGTRTLDSTSRQIKKKEEKETKTQKERDNSKVLWKETDKRQKKKKSVGQMIGCRTTTTGLPQKERRKWRRKWNAQKSPSKPEVWSFKGNIYICIDIDTTMYIYIRTSEQNQTTSSFESLINKILSPRQQSAGFLAKLASWLEKFRLSFLGRTQFYSLKNEKRKKWQKKGESKNL